MTPSSAPLHLVVRFLMAQQHAAIAHVVAEGVDDLVIQEFEQLGAGVDQVDLAVEIAEHRRIFAADHAGPVDGHR